MTVCNKCQTILTDKNWSPSTKNRFHNICKHCEYLYRKQFKPSKKEDPEKWQYQNDLTKLDKIFTRLEMIKAYGVNCVHCGENNPGFLVLDHINNNGYLEVVPNGHDFNRMLKRHGFPGKGTQLQLLCHNCNAVKEYQNNRKLGTEIVSTTAEVYIKQDYSISEEETLALKQQARYFFEKTEKRPPAPYPGRPKSTTPNISI